MSLRHGRTHHLRSPLSHRVIDVDWPPEQHGEFEIMATLGIFTERDGRLTGKLQTLSINNTLLVFVPNENQPSPDAPAYRVF